MNNEEKVRKLLKIYPASDVRFFDTASIDFDLFSRDDDGSVSQLLKIYQALSPTIKDKSDTKRIMKDIRNLPLTEQIIDFYVEDTLHLHSDSYLPVSIVSSDKKAPDRIMEKLMEMKILDVLKETLPMALFYGEYLYLWDGHELDDWYPQDRFVVISSRGNRVIVADPEVKANIHDDKKGVIKLERQSLIDYLKNHSVLLQLRGIVGTISAKDRSDYVYKVIRGRGIFTSAVVSLIKSINLMEKIIPISAVLAIDSRFVVYLDVPAGAPANEVMKKVRQIQRLLNVTSDSIKLGEEEDILNQIGKYKVIPSWGDRAKIDPRELPRPERPDLNSIQEMKTNLATLTKIPPSYFGMQGSGDKAEKIPYLQRIYSIRQSIVRFIEEALVRAGVSLDGVTIEAQKPFGLEDLEMSDAMEMTSMGLRGIGDVVSALSQMVQDSGQYLDLDALAALFNDRLHKFTDGRDIIDPEGLKKKIEAEMR